MSRPGSSAPTHLRLVRGRAAQDAPPAGEDVLSWAFRRWGNYVATVALRLLGGPADVDDVVQDVFAEAIKGLGQLRNPEAVKPWLGAVTVRVASRRLRTRRLQRLFGIEAVPDFEDVRGHDVAPDDRALLAAVYRVLGGVPVQARVAWILRHLEGERLEAIAEMCRCSLATAKRRIAAAEQAIDEVFDDR
jgi:RNA polymerase sigma-70 factor (ECF subfamily)